MREIKYVFNPLLLVFMMLALFSGLAYPQGGFPEPQLSE